MTCLNHINLKLFFNVHSIDHDDYDYDDSDAYDYGYDDELGLNATYVITTTQDGCTGTVTKHNICNIKEFPSEKLMNIRRFKNVSPKNFCCDKQGYVAVDECEGRNIFNNLLHFKSDLLHPFKDQCNKIW